MILVSKLGWWFILLYYISLVFWSPPHIQTLTVAMLTYEQYRVIHLVLKWSLLYKEYANPKSPKMCLNALFDVTHLTERNREKNCSQSMLLSGIMLARPACSSLMYRVHWRALIVWVSVHPFKAAVKAILSELTPWGGFGLGQQAEVSITKGTCFPGTVFGAAHLTWRNSQSSVSGN